MTEDIIAKPLEEQVFRTLEEEILSGERAPGTSLSEVAVGERLGVSRTPVRAALHRLKEEGLVEIVPHKGAKVIGVSIDEVMSTYYIRMRLEGLAVRMAIERLTEQEIVELTRFVELSEYYSSKGDADMLKDMDKRGKVINMAFAVSGAFALGDHLAYTASYDPKMIPALVVGKLCAGIAAVAVAIFASKEKANV